MAEEFLRRGKRVIVTGRRQANLDSFVSKHGTDRCKSVQMDVTDFASIPAKIAACMNAFDGTAVDSVYVGSGIQRPADFSKPESIDMNAVEMEIKTNYVRRDASHDSFLPANTEHESSSHQVAYLHIAKAVLPYLFKQDRPTSFMVRRFGW
jgi:short-subunit dehydrogenase involved in D-alanine esterification of teichoic acids